MGRESSTAGIIMGKRPVQEFRRFVDLWYRSGGAEITDEANRWWARVAAWREP